MIIQLRGTSGSGKTTAMRAIMESYGPWKPVYREGRKRPLFYSHWLHRVVVLGHYETACGGCDSIGSARAVYDTATDLLEAGERVLLMEGLLLSEDVKWSSQLPDLRAVFLTTDVEDCLAGIRERREEAGQEKPLNEYNTRNRVGVIERARLRLGGAGVRTVRASRRQAPELVLKWLREEESKWTTKLPG